MDGKEALAFMSENESFLEGAKTSNIPLTLFHAMRASDSLALVQRDEVRQLLADGLLEEIEAASADRIRYRVTDLGKTSVEHHGRFFHNGDGDLK